MWFLRSLSCKLYIAKGGRLFSKYSRADLTDGSGVRTLWKKLFGKYLLTTNIISSGVLMAAGDVLSQELEYQRNVSDQRFNKERIGQMFLVGSLQGPLHHYFYQWLDSAMVKVTLTATFIKIISDQVIMSPICLLIFFYPAGLLEGKSMMECNSEFRKKFWPVYMVDWAVWPAAQFINFHYLQPKYRVIYINFVTMLYNVFLSYMKHNDESTVRFLFNTNVEGVEKTDMPPT